MTPDKSPPGNHVGKRILLSFVLSALIPIFTIYLVSYNQISSQLDNEVRRQIYENSRSLGLGVYDKLLSAELNMKIIANGLRDGSRLSELLKNELVGTLFNGMSVYDGDELLETLFGRDITYIEHVPEQTRHLADGNTALLVVGVAGQNPEVLLLRNLDARIYGKPVVLAASIRADYLWNFAVYSPEFVCILDPGDYPLYCSMLIDHEDIQSLADELNSAPANTPVSWNFDRANYTASSWDIFLRARFQTDDLSLVLAVPTESAFMSFDDFKSTFPKILIITGLLVALLSISQIRKTLRPLQKLTDATRRIASGNYSEPVVIDSADEFSALADSFNDMAKHIEQQIKTLSAMTEIDRLILSSLDTEYVIRTLVVYLHEITRAGRIGVITLEKKDSRAARLYVAEDPATRSLRADEITLDKSELAEMETVDRYLQTDDPSSRSYLCRMAATDIKHFIVFPVRIRNELSALICLGNRNGISMDEQTLKRIEELSDRVAVALSSALWEERLFYQSHFDALTGLPNRFLFRDRLRLAIERAGKSGHGLALLLIDLDHFKQVNDQYGHETGDKLLGRVAQELLENVPTQDALCRSGGDEFMMLIQDIAEPGGAVSEAERLCGRLIRRMASPIQVETREIAISASIGIALFPRDATGCEELLKCADLAMYDAKSSGRNTFRFFNREHNRLVQESIHLRAQLAQAIDRNELCLYYQPKIVCASGRVTGTEALLRWQHPQKGLISPYDHIPELRRSGQAIPIHDWVLEHACRQHQDLLNAGVSNLVLAVNIPVEQFRRGHLSECIAEVLARTGLPPSLLEVEITESSTTEDLDRAVGVMRELKRLGIGITIDDFGTGYSSLSGLQQIPADRLKIDRVFVSGLSEHGNSTPIVSAIIALAHNLGMTVVAEGVETQAQCDILMKLGCDELQGHFITQPLSAANFRAFMLRENALQGRGTPD